MRLKRVMPVYSLKFSEKLIDAAKVVASEGLDAIDSKRAVLYLSLLACEIILKALLEQAGVPANKIRKRSHKLSELLLDLGSCKVKDDIGSGTNRWVSARRLRSIEVDKNFSDATIGKIIEAESAGASTYPNKIRYGENPTHYDPELVLKAATLMAVWARKHWTSIRVPQVNSIEYNNL